MTTFPEKSSILLELECILNIQNALNLLKMSSGLSDSDTNDKETHSAFNAFFEALVFDKIARRPFFETIRYIEPYSIFKLIQDRKIILPCKLTYQQIFTILKSFRFSESKRIIELLPLSPQIFNSLLLSIENNEFDNFSKALDRCETLDWFDWLSSLGYVCFGAFPSDCVNTSSSNSVCRLPNNWLLGLGFDEYFANNRVIDGIEFINREQRRWSGIEIDKSLKQRRKRLFHRSSDDVYRSMKDYNLFFSPSLVLWDSSYVQPWFNYSEIVCNAQLTTDAIFKEIFDRNSRILVSDEGRSANILDYFADLKCIDTRDILPLQRFVSATSMAMVQIFALVESLLPDETKQSLQYILEANPYTLRAMEVKSNYIINWTSSVERREYSLELIKDTDYNNDPEYTKTEICLRKFIDENFGFDDGQKQHFIDSYQKGMMEYISSTKNAITLFALVYLIYPVKKLTGKGATDHVEKGKHLCRGIMWKDEPENSGEVLDLLSRYFPQLKKWGYACESTKTPSKSINYLVKEVRNGNRWIESFIEDYWPNDPMTDFKEKLKGALK